MLYLEKFTYTSVLILIGAMLLCTAPVHADDTIRQHNKYLPDYHQKIGFTYTAGANLVSNYLWRGFSVGGLSLQPDFNVGYGGLSVGAWWNIGCDKNDFKRFFPEVDVYVQFSRWGLTVSLTHMYYFNGRFFNFAQKDFYGGGNSNNTELHLQYRVSDELPLSVDWYTHIASEDGYIVDENGDFAGRTLAEGTDSKNYTIRRAYSSYLQIGYDFRLPYDITIPVRIGMTPWRSRYTQYERRAAVNCIAVSIEKKFSLDICSINIFAKAMLNPDRISKSNVWVKISERDWHRNEYNSHLMGNIGIGVWF